MKKLFAMITGIVLLLNVSFGYTLTVSKGDFSIVRTGINPGTNVIL